MKRTIYNIKFYLGWLMYHASTIAERRIHINRIASMQYSERQYLSYLEYKLYYYKFSISIKEISKLMDLAASIRKNEHKIMLKGVAKVSELASIRAKLNKFRSGNNG